MWPAEVISPVRVKSCRKLPALGRCIGVKRSHDMLLNRSAVCCLCLIASPSSSPSPLSVSLHLPDFSLYWWGTFNFFHIGLSHFPPNLYKFVADMSRVLTNKPLSRNAAIHLYKPRNALLQSAVHDGSAEGQINQIKTSAPLHSKSVWAEQPCDGWRHSLQKL